MRMTGNLVPHAVLFEKFCRSLHPFPSITSRKPAHCPLQRSVIGPNRRKHPEHLLVIQFNQYLPSNTVDYVSSGPSRRNPHSCTDEGATRQNSRSWVQVNTGTWIIRDRKNDIVIDVCNIRFRERYGTIRCMYPMSITSEKLRTQCRLLMCEKHKTYVRT